MQDVVVDLAGLEQGQTGVDLADQVNPPIGNQAVDPVAAAHPETVLAGENLLFGDRLGPAVQF